MFFFSCVHTAKVGKTSLIMSLVSEEFPDEVCGSTDHQTDLHTHIQIVYVKAQQLILLIKKEYNFVSSH